MKKYGILTVKIILWGLVSLIFLVLLAFVLIRVPAVQNFALRKTVAYLEGKLKTKVEIKRMTFDFPKLLVLEDVYFEDQKKDTLLAGDTLKVDISLFKLLDDQVEINEIDLRGMTVNVNRTLPDSAFNFDYILKAFGFEKTGPPDTTAAMRFSISSINLDRIRTSYRDAVTGSDMSLYLSHFDTKIRDFDMDKMKFTVPAIKLSGLNAVIIQKKPVGKPESYTQDSIEAAKPPDMYLTLGTVSFDRVKVYYQNDISLVKADVNLEKLNLESDKIDMRNQRIALKTLDLSDSKILLQFGKSQQAKVAIREAKKEVELEAQNWQFAVNGLVLKNDDIIFDDFNIPVLKRGMDYSHLNIKGLSLSAGKFMFATDSISANITAANFKEKSGFELKELQTNFFYGPERIDLEDLYLQTSQSVIRNNIHLKYSSIEDIYKNTDDLGIEINLNKSRIGLRDVLIFVPALASVDPFKSNPNSSFNIDGRVTGKVNNLNIPYLEISGLTNTRIRASGRITGLPDQKRAYYDLTVREFRSGSRDLNVLVSRDVIPANIRLPESLNLSGTFKGNVSNFNSNFALDSSFGSAKATGGMKGESFDADLQLNNFQVGRLIMQDSVIGNVTAALRVSGAGLDPKKMKAKFSGTAQRVDLKGYSYRNLVIDGSIDNQNINTALSINDPNVRLKIDAKANISSTYPSVNFILNVDSANLHALKLYDTELLFRGKIVADLPSTDPDRLIGKIDMSNSVIALNGRRYQLDSVQVIASANGDLRDLRLRSEIVTANISGKYTLTEVGNSLINEINKYFKVGDGKILPVRNAQDFSFAVHMVNSPVLQTFVPELTKMESADVSGSFNSITGALSITGSVPQLTYMGYSLTNLRLNAGTGNNAINYTASFDEAGSSAMKINQTVLKGKAQNNLLNVDMNVKDKGGKDQYRIAGIFSVLQDQYQFKFDQNGLMLNYDAWTVSNDNALQFGPGGILAQNFGLSRAGQQLSINSSPMTLNAPLSVTFTDFRIETITAIAKKDSLLAGGVINGNALVSNLQTSPVFTADLKIKDFNFMTDTVGDVELRVNNTRPDTYEANAHITGKGNDLVLSGFYYAKPQSTGNFDLNVDINTINLASVQGFTMGYIRQSSGSLQGKLKITGTVSQPVIRGDINFRQAAFNISMLNSIYRIPDGGVSLTSEGIEFDAVTLLDSAGNEALIDGIIYTKNYLDYRFGLSLQTENFMALNSTKKDNRLYYGSVYLSSDLDIEGDLTRPAISGRVRINEGTDFTVVLPQNDPAVQDREGIVEFVNMNDPEFMTAFLKSQVDSLQTSEIRGVNLSMNIEVDSTAVFSIIIDEGNGDFVRVQGQAQLSAGVDPSGKISLTGNYVLAKGAYEMSYNFIRRRFDIERGSTITWTGELTAANLNVRAVYLANTAPLDLVNNQLGSVTATERNRYKQKLPFEVYLVLKGEVLKPEITFDIDLPAGRNYFVSKDVLSVVNTRLEQIKQEPNELNKQVFSLLLLNRFTSENPFHNEAGGGGVQTFVRQSVSNILTDQLNSIAGGLIQGVDLNFDLVSSEDYTSGSLKNRTDLNVGFSKRLLSDRLKVSIGSNFELEGSQTSNQSASNIAGNIALDYQLSKDGRYMLRAYRKNITDAVVEGYVIETGLGFLISMDYNKFRELFLRRTEEDKFIRKENKKERKNKKKEDKQAVEV